MPLRTKIAAVLVGVVPGPRLGAGDGPALDWSCSSLPEGVRVTSEVEHEAAPNQWVIHGTVDATITREWVESRYWITHAGAGRTLSTYIHASADDTIDYRPESDLAEHRNTFGHVGSALGGSDFSPFDPVRMMIRASQAGRRVLQTTEGQATVYEFTPMWTPDGRSVLRLKVDADRRVLASDLLVDRERRLSSQTVYSGYRRLPDGTWFPMVSTTETFGDHRFRYRHRITSLESKPLGPPPPVANLPAQAIHYDLDRAVQIDANGQEIGAWPPPTGRSSSGTQLPQGWLSYLFTALGAAMIVGAGIIWRRRHP